jgi:DNA binding domain, excisionase family
LEELFTQGFNEVQAKRDMLNRYMNKKQTCLYLQISNNTLDKWIREEKLPVIRLNGSLRFDRIEIDKWLHQVAKIS